MSTIDRCNYILTCKKCDISETASVLDKGSMYGGSVWQERADFAHFNTKWSGGGKIEPELKQATCKICGCTADVESNYRI